MIKFVFSSPEEALTLMSQEDAYLTKLNQYNLDLYDIKNKQVYLDTLKTCTVPFSSDQIENIKKIEDSFNKQVIQHFPINSQAKDALVVNLIKSDGSECGLAYTRLNFIVFTQRMMNFEAYVIHELFHVISRQNPVLTHRLYEALGFRKAETDLLDLHNINYILNPDAPVNNYYLPKDNIKIIPYAEDLGLKYRFLILDEHNNIADLPDKTKKNYGKSFVKTFEPISYIIHPEEIIAELWSAYWIQNLGIKSTVKNHSTDLDHPLIKKMKNILKDFEIRT